MSKRFYPRIASRSSSKYYRQGSTKCKICGQPGFDTILVVQFSWFRADDETYRVHGACLEGETDDQILVRLGYKFKR